ncbi:hypothetical protein SETIT_8G046700v2 [Setaria italica]|uniref:Uncharacterized protein n=2 Tax=Setaria TaxID=4554 RepID=A0A368S4H4_SETIT|nr:hypothetical protein SETIT_8G046700v2 [Setaria italica]TKV99477.1 hypothetical protein SEVIR_8G046500v2 [Setaria viridis]
MIRRAEKIKTVTNWLGIRGKREIHIRLKTTKRKMKSRHCMDRMAVIHFTVASVW